MTIKPIKSDNNESDVNSQHRECLNKISSPKSPVSLQRKQISLIFRIEIIKHKYITNDFIDTFCLDKTVITTWNRTTKWFT